ncbi:Chromatin SPT [Parasponia andersonii]|uniref:Chromatin SPT n=1 Tax=Parasponia andersonii TaxID=3476 RepID=A0A2P5BIS0_PARAD|nr:Chromatin SPT [Parasponia andersonii]
MEDEYDDYEDSGYGQEEDGEEGEEEEVEYEEEEERKPTKEELDYLQLRQRLKERIRKQMKKEGGSALNNSNDRKRKLPYDNFGSFFGPSQPFIAARVIQESKSLLETQHLTPQLSNSFHPNKKSSGSSTAGSKPGIHDQKAKVVNEAKTRVQKLKDTRDYSFLLSDNAELPAPAKAPQQKNVPVPNSDARPAQVLMKSKQALGNNGRHAQGSHVERSHVERKSVPTNGHLHSKVGSNNLPSAGRPSSASMDSRRQHSSSNGTGPGRPLAKSLPSKIPALVEKKVSTSATKSSIPSTQKPKPLPSNLQPSIPRQQLVQKRELQAPAKAKLLPKQPSGLSKPQLSKPQKQIPSRLPSQENRPKKKPMRGYSDDEDEQAISMIRKMFGYNPNRYADGDDDVSDMEANFDDIMREEKRSTLIARKEDEEQLRLIEEEERRERLAKKKKLKRKLGE